MTGLFCLMPKLTYCVLLLTSSISIFEDYEQTLNAYANYTVEANVWSVEAIEQPLRVTNYRFSFEQNVCRLYFFDVQTGTPYELHHQGLSRCLTD